MKETKYRLSAGPNPPANCRNVQAAEGVGLAICNTRAADMKGDRLDLAPRTADGGQTEKS